MGDIVSSQLDSQLKVYIFKFLFNKLKDSWYC
jgi:hypothetical protein